MSIISITIDYTENFALRIGTHSDSKSRLRQLSKTKRKLRFLLDQSTPQQTWKLISKAAKKLKRTNDYDKFPICLQNKF